MINTEVLSRYKAQSKLKPMAFDLAWAAVDMRGEFRPAKEYIGLPGRKFRFDFAWPELRTALEIDGGIFLKRGGHTTGVGKRRDAEKDWLAAQNGWRVIRWTTDMVGIKNCEILLALLKQQK